MSYLATCGFSRLGLHNGLLGWILGFVVGLVDLLIWWVWWVPGFREFAWVGVIYPIVLDF